MKFAWKLFFTTYALLIFSFGLGGFLLIRSTFDSMLSARQTAVSEKNESSRFSYQLVLMMDELLSTNLSQSYQQSGMGGGTAITRENPFPEPLGSSQQGSRIFSQGEEIYFQAVSTVDGPQGYPLYVESREAVTDIYRLRQRNYLIFCLILLGVTTFSGGALFFFCRRLTRPLGQLARTAGFLGGGDYSRRAPEGSSTWEIAALSHAFNQMADQVEAQIEELKEEARRRDEFVANFTHELKTPLTSMMGYADMMRSYELPAPQRREYSDFIYREGARLEGLSLRLLDLMVLGAAPPATTPISARTLFAKTRQAVLPGLQRARIQLFVEGENAQLLADPDLVETLLYNLTDNARKAMEGQLRQILIKGRTVGGRYRITVADTGRGIPAEQLSRVTEAFYMVDKSRARKQGGAGLGLALCQKIARLHGSELELLSRPGEGTAVTFSLPLAGPLGPDASTPALTAPRALEAPAGQASNVGHSASPSPGPAPAKKPKEVRP